MPLPPALLARLQKRGLVAKNPDKPANEVEEVFAEDYDDPVKPYVAEEPPNVEDIPRPDDIIQKPIEEVVEEDVVQEDGPLVYEVSACPNKWNIYHTCSDYCNDRWGLKKFENELEVDERRRHRMLRKYPLPEGWEEVADPSTSRYYYWNSETDEVAWLSPIHPRAKITFSAEKLQAVLGATAILQAEKESMEVDATDEMPVDDEKMESDSSLSDSGSDDERGHEQQRRDRERERARERDRERDRDRDRDRDRRGRDRDQDRRGRRRKEDEVDPMDPSSYSEAPRGTWSSGLDKRGEAKTGVDTTASGPLFQQRPYPSPGDILRANRKSTEPPPS